MIVSDYIFDRSASGMAHGRCHETIIYKCDKLIRLFRVTILISTLYAQRVTPTIICTGMKISFRGGGIDSSSQVSNIVKESEYPIRNTSTSNVFLPSLFDMADEVKSDVASDPSFDPQESARLFESGGRGGALVTVKQQPSSSSFSQWFKPFGMKQLNVYKNPLYNSIQTEEEISSRTSSMPDGRIMKTLSDESSSSFFPQNFWTDTWSGNLFDQSNDDTQHVNSNNENIDSTFALEHNQTDQGEMPENLTDLRERDIETNDVTEPLVKNEEEVVPFVEGQVSSHSDKNHLDNLIHDVSKGLTEIDNYFDNNTDYSLVDLDEKSLQKHSTFRSIRKAGARATGMHGLVSGKYRSKTDSIDNIESTKKPTLEVSIKRERDRLWKATTENEVFKNLHHLIRGTKGNEPIPEQIRINRVKEIDNQIEAAQLRLFELACEKDVLQERPNPLWNYSVNHLPDTNNSKHRISATREFNFPSPDMVEDYLDNLFAAGRIVKMNHTALLQRNVESEDEDELPLSFFYKDHVQRRRRVTDAETQSSGSWFLRNGLGEKIGETAETSAYKAVCQSVMSVLARSLSGLHGINVMGFSDVRLFKEQTPSLPPLSESFPPGNYAQEAVYDAVRRGTKKKNKQRSTKLRSTRDAFIQRDAVVETLLSQSQIATPLLKLFPLIWQRAILANIVTLVTAVITDFCEGLEFQILGHKLTISFTPITEEDMLRGIIHDSFLSERYVRSAFFEAAVEATAEDVGKNLKFLDRWHERILGGGMLRTQIASLIARLVLTLVDDILRGAKMNLWTAQAGGPRLAAALEYRVTQNNIEDVAGQIKT